MPVYEIEIAVFKMFPDYRRGIVIASGIDNRFGGVDAARLLADAVSRVAPAITQVEEERLTVWNEAYQKLGVDPSRYVPSVRFLFEQIRRGKPPRSISKIVDIMNSASISWIAPCGGDDLDSLNGGDLRLGLARGDEIFAPLFKPSASEHPNPGEIIYYTPQTRRVLCRRWTWRNADFSKLTADTKSVAINIDVMMPPFDEAQLNAAIASVETSLLKLCGGSARTYVLSPSNNCICIKM